MFFSLAWRNIWRNRARAWGLLGGISLSVSCLWVLSAVIRGANGQRLTERLEMSLGHIKITHRNFLQHKPVNAFVLYDEQARQKLASLPFVEGISSRVNIRASVQNGRAWLPVDVYGVRPEAEKTVLRLYKCVEKGAYLPDSASSAVVVGKALAEKMRKNVGDSLLVFLPAPLRVKIVGIYNSPNKDFAQTHIFLHVAMLRRALRLPENACHQILLKTPSAEQARQYAGKLQTLFPHEQVRTWADTAPDLAYIHTLTSYFLGFVAFLAMLLLGVLQQMLWAMSWHERKTEWQRLHAWGLTKGELWRLWAIEVLMLCLLGWALGNLLGGGVLYALAQKGIPLSFFEGGLAKMGYSTQIYPVFWRQDWLTLAFFAACLPCLHLAYAWQCVRKVA